MDPRLAILLGASALLAVAFGYFVASLRRARRTGKDSAATILPPPLDTTARASLHTRLDLGAWVPERVPEDDAVQASDATLVVATEPISDDSRDDLSEDEIDVAVAALLADCGVPVEEPAVVRPAEDSGPEPLPMPSVAEPVWTPAPGPAAVPEALPVVAEYRMVAPVELSFADGIQRVGIRPGTATFLKYQRLAAVLLNDLKRSRQG